MDLKNLKITNYEDSVSALPDYPSDAGITAAQLKAVFDGRTDKEIKQKFNALIDELITKFGIVEVDIADAVEEHQQWEDAHEKIITPIQERIAEIIGEIITLDTGIAEHVEKRNNPHKVTAAQVGLDKVDNTPDHEKEVARAISAEMDFLGNVIHEHYATKDEVGNADLSRYYTKDETDNLFGEYIPPIENDINALSEQVGDVETALDAILAIQNELIGGETV